VLESELLSALEAVCQSALPKSSAWVFVCRSKPSRLVRQRHHAFRFVLATFALRLRSVFVCFRSKPTNRRSGDTHKSLVVLVSILESEQGSGCAPQRAGGDPSTRCGAERVEEASELLLKVEAGRIPHTCYRTHCLLHKLATTAGGTHTEKR